MPIFSWNRPTPTGASWTSNDETERDLLALAIATGVLRQSDRKASA